MSPGVDIARLIRQIPSQYPFVLVDRIEEHDPAGRLVAVKNVTGSEEFFEGHFPDAPVMPGVLIMECLAQAAGIWLLHDAPDPGRLEVHVVGIDGAKFRRPVVPGDQLRLEVTVLRRRRGLCRVRGRGQDRRPARGGGHAAAPAHRRAAARRGPHRARRGRARCWGRASGWGRTAWSGPQVRLGARTVLHSHVVIDGDTTIGADNQFFPFCSVGLVPQDLKFKGETHARRDRRPQPDPRVRHHPSRHRGGRRAHAPRLRQPDHGLRAHRARLHRWAAAPSSATAPRWPGHVEVQDYATVSAYSGVHQFCRVGTHSYTGGFTVATKDVLPYSKTVGNRAHIYGVNAIGLSPAGIHAAEPSPPSSARTGCCC